MMRVWTVVVAARARLTVIAAAVIAAAGTIALPAGDARGAAASAGCRLISKQRVGEIVGMPHTRLVHEGRECRYVAWAQAQEPAGVRGPKPLVVSVWAAGSEAQTGLLSLDLVLARRGLARTGRRLTLRALGQPHVAGFTSAAAARGQTGPSWSSTARGIWWSGPASAPRRGIEILVAAQGPRPESLSGELARIAAIVVASFGRHR